MKKKTIFISAAASLGFGAIWFFITKMPVGNSWSEEPVKSDVVRIDSVNKAEFQDGDRYEGGSLKPEFYWDRPARPFPVSHKSSNYEWTSEDGRDPAVMRKYSNNPEMLERLVSENEYVPRRQLIYLPENFAEIAQDIYDGKQKEFILPGFDGDEFTVVVTQVEPDLVPLEGSGPLSGSWKGHLKDDPTAEVFASSDSNYWSVVLDSDSRQYEYENRELGEWILQELDLEAMNHAVPACAIVPSIDDVGDLIATE